MKRVSLLLVLFISLINISLVGQTTSKTRIIKGQLVDTLANETIPFATIKLLKNEKDAKVIRAIASDDNGKFQMNIDNNADFVLRIEFIGKESVSVPISANSNSPVDLGKIKMKDDSKVLNEVVVSAQRPLIKVDLDKITYSIEEDPEANVNNVLDMLKKVPLVTVDGEENIQLKGSSNFKIYMNGKPSNMISNNPKDVLKSMPANTIKDIEVITDPGAKYDAEGVSGIINIITHKNSSMKGYTTTINTGADTRGGFNAGAHLMTKIDKIGFNGNFNHYNFRRPRGTSETNREFFTNAGEYRKDKYLSQSSSSKNKGHGFWGSGELSYEIDTLNLVNVSFNHYNGVNKSNSNSISESLDSNEDMNYRYSNDGQGKDKYGNTSINADYQHTFAGMKGRLLTVSYQYNNSPNDSKNDNTVTELSGVVPSNIISLGDKYQSSDGKLHEHTIQSDFVTPFAKIHSLETGIKYISRNNKSDSENNLWDNNSNSWLPDPNIDQIQNEFKHETNILGAYAGYSLKVKKIGLKTGLRYEYSDLKVKFQRDRSRNFDNSYNNFIPSITMTYQLKQTQSLRVGYNMRINRPGIWQLNPYRNTSNPSMVTEGNPNLDPVKSHNISLNYMFFNPKLNINANLSYNFQDKGIETVYLQDPIDEDITIQTYQNIGKKKDVNLSVYVNWTPTQKLRIFSNMSGAYADIHSNDQKSTKKVHGFNARAFMGVQYKMWWNLTASLHGGYFGARKGLESKSPNYHFHSISLRRSFINDRLNIGVYASNPFKNSNSFKNSIENDIFRSLSRSVNKNRQFGINISFKIGELKTSIKKASRGISNDDIMSGGGGQQGGGGEGGSTPQ